MTITLRPAVEADLDTVYAWLNDPETRAASFQSEPVPYEDHVRWFRGSLVRSDRHLFLAERDGTAAAVVRFDSVGEGEAEISINVSPDQRGRGVGVEALQAASVTAQELGIKKILAFIRPGNEASIKAFERAGYMRGQDRVVRGVAAHCWELTF